MRPFASGAASVATVMACKMANLTAAAAAGIDVVVPAGDNNDGFQMPSKGQQKPLPHGRLSMRRMDGAAVVAALHFAHDNGNWKLLDVENARVAAAAANAAAAAAADYHPDECFSG
ncbi:hypothetical protein ACLKA7_005262 [Drosophila subpalustris]